MGSLKLRLALHASTFEQPTTQPWSKIKTSLLDKKAGSFVLGPGVEYAHVIHLDPQEGGALGILSNQIVDLLTRFLKLTATHGGAGSLAVRAVPHGPDGHLRVQSLPFTLSLIYARLVQSAYIKGKADERLPREFGEVTGHGAANAGNQGEYDKFVHTYWAWETAGRLWLWLL